MEAQRAGGGAPGRLADQIVPFATLRRFRRGRLLLDPGDTSQDVLLVRSGQARLYLVDEAGHETTTAIVGPGHVLGIGRIVGEPQQDALAQALTPVEAWVMPAGRLQEWLRHDPRLCYDLLGALARQLWLTEGLLKDVSLLPVAQRIPDALARLQVCLSGEEPRLSQAQVGALVAARRESVNRATATRRARLHPLSPTCRRDV